MKHKIKVKTNLTIGDHIVGEQYPLDILERAVDLFNQRDLRVGMLLDSTDLTVDDPTLDVKLASHKVIRAYIEDDILYVGIKTLDTDMGLELDKILSGEGKCSAKVFLYESVTERTDHSVLTLYHISFVRE